nr:MAG TPA: hypothetical protein [Caudoviricetes sp.]
MYIGGTEPKSKKRKTWVLYKYKLCVNTIHNNFGKLVKGQIQTFSEHISGYKRSIIAYIP